MHLSRLCPDLAAKEKWHVLYIRHIHYGLKTVPKLFTLEMCPCLAPECSIRHGRIMATQYWHLQSTARATVPPQHGKKPILPQQMSPWDSAVGTPNKTMALTFLRPRPANHPSGIHLGKVGSGCPKRFFPAVYAFLLPSVGSDWCAQLI